MADQQVPQISTTDERAMRRAKRAALIEQGVNPYPIKSYVDAHVAVPRASVQATVPNWART